MALNYVMQRPRFRIPDPNSLIQRSRSNKLAVRREGQSRDAAGMAIVLFRERTRAIFSFRNTFYPGGKLIRVLVSNYTLFGA